MDFHEYSKGIVKEYISSVAYVDDLIFSSDSVRKIIASPVKETVEVSLETQTVLPSINMREHAANQDVKKEEVVLPEQRALEDPMIPNINPLEFTNAFLEEGIHCTLMELDKDKNNLARIKETLKKTDVIILDWQMHQDLGESATDILLSVLNQNTNNPELRLFIIYTDSKNYKEILSEKIISKLDKSVKTDQPDDCHLNIGHSKIVVFKKKGKSEGEGIADTELPGKVIEELTLITEGLVSNTALKSISLLRKNSCLLLGLFNKDLDKAYLTHRAMCPHPEDAETLLTRLIVDSMEAVLFYANVSEVCDSNQIDRWLTKNKLPQQEFEAKNQKYVVDIDKYVIWQKYGFTRLMQELNKKFALQDIEKIENKKLKKLAVKCFSDGSQINEKFAELTHHKSCLKGPSYLPYLTLGVLVMKEEKYYLCIQQRCDSLRITKEENESGGRAFWFLPLKDKGGKYSILFEGGENNFLSYKVCDKNCHALEIFFFKSQEDGGCVRAIKDEKENNNYYFEDIQGHKYKWVLELKDFHAQRIANNFAAEFSRVGLDESEWLRREN